MVNKDFHFTSKPMAHKTTASSNQVPEAELLTVLPHSSMRG